MKEYKRMAPGANLSWCAPFVSGNKYYVQHEGEITNIMADGMDLVIDADTLRIVSDTDDWQEIGCSECPWRDECDAMDSDAEDWTDEDLADVVADSDKWDDPDTEEAMSELCARAGQKLREMVRGGGDVSEYMADLRKSCAAEGFLDDTPDISDDQEDLIDWLQYGGEQADQLHLAYVVQNILGVALV